MAQYSETELNTKIAAIDSQLDDLVASGVVGFNAGAGGPSVSGNAITALLKAREHYVKMRNALPAGEFATLEYEVDEYGKDVTEYQDG